MEACTCQSLKTSPVFSFDHPHDLAVLHAGDAIGKLENACVVGDDNKCPVGALRNAAQYFHYASPRLMIQIARRFVADDELRVVNQCPGDSHALLLSGAKLERS